MVRPVLAEAAFAFRPRPGLYVHAPPPSFPGCRLASSLLILNMISLNKLTLPVAALVLAACSDTANPVLSETPVPETAVTVAMTCTVSTRGGPVRCSDGVTMQGGASGLIVGGQNQYVQLGASDIQTVADTIAFDVTITNLLPQALGTTDGDTLDPDGIRVFFTAGPASAGAGSVEVANPDGFATFTGPNQPYYQYPGLLEQNQISVAKRWKLQFSPGVQNITFKVLVSANVQYPEGYVTETPYVLVLNPNESRTVTGTVLTAVGNPIPGAVIDWTSNDPAIASVNGSQVTAGPSRGLTELTAVSGGRPAVYSTAVSVCPSTVVTDGTSLPASIATTDCVSSYGSEEGKPNVNLYADLYRVNLTAGQTITVLMDSGNQLDTYLLLAPLRTGLLAAANDDDEEEALGSGSRMVYTATETGVYVIEGTTFSDGATGNYTLSVTID